jgi:chemotaxis methyl-accepting protein methylase
MDPPFTRLDILTCRNVLIYLGAELQKRLLPLFHYSLKPGGALFLGSAESIGNFAELFTRSKPRHESIAGKKRSKDHSISTSRPATPTIPPTSP